MTTKKRNKSDVEKNEMASEITELCYRRRYRPQLEIQLIILPIFKINVFGRRHKLSFNFKNSTNKFYNFIIFSIIWYFKTEIMSSEQNL